MEENQMNERIVYLGSFLDSNPVYPRKMEERDKKLLNLVKEFNSLPEKQRNNLKPLLNKTIERHKEIRRYSKVLEYYFTKYKISLEVK